MFFSVDGGWGTVSQKAAGDKFIATVEVEKGRVELLKLLVKIKGRAKKVSAKLGNKTLKAKLRGKEGLVEIRLEKPVVIMPDKPLVVTLK